MPAPKDKTPAVRVDSRLFRSATIHENVAQQIIIITADRAKLCLMEHKRSLSSRFAWIAPLGLVATGVTTLVTSTFHDALGISASTWQAVFVLGTILSTLWLVISIGLLVYRRKERTLDYLMAKLKAESTSE